MVWWRQGHSQRCTVRRFCFFFPSGWLVETFLFDSVWAGSMNITGWVCVVGWLVGYVYVQKIEYCMRSAWLLAGPHIPSLPSPPPLRVHMFISCPIHHIMYTLLFCCLLSCIFLFQLGMMIRAVWTWDETADNRLKKGGVGQFLSDGILLSSFLLCLLPRVSGWHLRSALYTYGYRGDWMSRVHL